MAHCEFDNLSYDVLHNRILKSTLTRLLKIKDIHSDVRSGLIEHWRRLIRVRDIQLTERTFAQVQLHRNNNFYDFLLRVCRLLFRNLLPTQEPGGWKFRSFLQDDKQMASLFEAFVRSFYRHEAPKKFGNGNVKVGRNVIDWKFAPYNQEAVNALPKMQTDVTVTKEERTNRMTSLKPLWPKRPR